MKKATSGVIIPESKSGLKLALHFGGPLSPKDSQGDGKAELVLSNAIKEPTDGQTITNGTATAEYNEGTKSWYVTPDGEGFKIGSKGSSLMATLAARLQGMLSHGILPDDVVPEPVDPGITIQKNIFG